MTSTDSCGHACGVWVVGYGRFVLALGLLCSDRHGCGCVMMYLLWAHVYYRTSCD